MRLIILINSLETEVPQYTTTHVALTAVRRDHEVFYADVGAFVFDEHGRLFVRVRPCPRDMPDVQRFFETLVQVETKQIELGPGDVLFLRNNPADDAAQRTWAQTVGMTFGSAAKRRGVLVLNDPDGLMHAMSKIYVQFLDEVIRPATLIAHDADELRAFVENHGSAVLKPIGGSGGRGVFVLKDADEPNLNAIAESLLETGYVVAQEYLPAAAEGDTRLFLLNGRILEVDGKIAAIRRLPADGDPRSNMSAGGKAIHADIDDVIRDIAERVRPRMIEDGMFLAGLDIAGGKVMEVNVFSPGGLGSASRLEKVDFVGAVVDAMEGKIATISDAGRFDNRMLATL
jgi:glutathione synthase